MREILFRGKTKLDEWIYGDIFQNYDGRIFVGELVVDDYHGDCDDRYTLGEGFYEVIPETVGQYVGVVDTNGIKIFEGDIIGGDEHMSSITHCANTGQTNIVNWTNKDIRTLVEFTPGNLQLISYQIRNHKFTVLGNIHDNPGLLERK